MKHKQILSALEVIVEGSLYTVSPPFASPLQHLIAYRGLIFRIRCLSYTSALVHLKSQYTIHASASTAIMSPSSHPIPSK